MGVIQIGINSNLPESPSNVKSGNYSLEFDSAGKLYIHDENETLVYCIDTNTVSDAFVTGGTLNGSVLELKRGGGLSDVTIELGDLIGEGGGVGSVTSFTSIASLTSGVPTVVNHNLGSENIMVQTWQESNDELIDMCIYRHSGDPSNAITLLSPVSGSFRVNVVSAEGVVATNDIFNTVVTLSSGVPLQILHNLNTPNILFQSWQESNNELVDICVHKQSENENNVLVIESPVGGTFRINIIGL